jgi:hypothetical protein
MGMEIEAWLVGLAFGSIAAIKIFTANPDLANKLSGLFS